MTCSGYKRRTVGENIAWGSGPLGSPDNIFESWKNNSGRNANIPNGEVEEIGIGATSAIAKGYGRATMWIADFGAR